MKFLDIIFFLILLKNFPIKKCNELNFSAKWAIDDESLLKSKICILMYLINSTSCIESLHAQSCFFVGEVYTYQPISLCLPLNELDRVINFKQDFKRHLLV